MRALRFLRQVLSPIVVLAAYAGGFYAMRWLTADSLDIINREVMTFESMIVFGVTVLAWACYAWLALGTLLMALSAIPGAVGRACGAVADKVTPAAYRKAAKFALGISLAAGPVLGAVPAHAAPADAPTQTTASAAAMQLPSLDRGSSVDSQMPGFAQLPSLDRSAPSGFSGAGGMAIPERPTTGVDQAMVDPGGPGPETGDSSEAQQIQHVVQRGDNLWNIAKQHLPEGATNAEINAEWQRWYEENQEVIGGNPDLILPGQVFNAPPAR